MFVIGAGKPYRRANSRKASSNSDRVGPPARRGSRKGSSAWCAGWRGWRSSSSARSEQVERVGEAGVAHHAPERLVGQPRRHVEHRPGRAGDGDAELTGDVAARQGGRAMDGDARARRRSDFAVTSSGADQSLTYFQRLAADPWLRTAPVAAGEHGGVGARHHPQRHVPDRVDAAVDGDQPADRDPVLDRPSVRGRGPAAVGG